MIPLKLKPVPLVAICEIVIALAPELVRASETVLLVEVCTVPKLMLVGLATTDPEEVTPFPVICTAREVQVQLPFVAYL